MGDKPFVPHPPPPIWGVNSFYNNGMEREREGESCQLSTISFQLRRGSCDSGLIYRDEGDHAPNQRPKTKEKALSGIWNGESGIRFSPSPLSPSSLLNDCPTVFKGTVVSPRFRSPLRPPRPLRLDKPHLQKLKSRSKTLRLVTLDFEPANPPAVSAVFHSQPSD
jgi:hypothetical protein